MKFYASIFFLYAFLALSTTSVKVDYTGHMVIRVFPETTEQIHFLTEWESTSSVDFWSRSSTIERFTDLRVNPESYNDIAKILLDNKLNHKILIANLGELERQEQQEIALRRALYNGNKAIDVENYHTYEEVMAYLADLASTNPLVTTMVAGASVEGRDIVQATISSDLAANKPIAWFDCNIHAREWITAATCIWIIDTITTGYGSDPEITALVDQYDWKFVPIANPDGYAFSWTNDRLWRKNRAVNPGSICMGVDLNRNFPVGFGGTGSSNGPCSETFHGAAAFSEPESNTLKNLIAADQGRVKTAISMHSYSQLWLSSYSYTSALPSDYTTMLRAMRAGVDAITATYGTVYNYGSTGTVLYIASGVSTDHYYVNEGVLHSYTIELRDTGLYGFELPPRLIVPTATETWNGIKAFMNAI